MTRQRGFTLIEAVIVVFIAAVCSGVMVDLFLGQNRLYNTETEQLNITNDARNSLDDIDSDVRQANRVLASYSTYTGGAQVLILQIQSVDSSNNLIGGTYDDVVYYLTGTDLYRQVYPDASSSRQSITQKVASNVQSLAFTYDNTDFTLVTEVSTDLTIKETGEQSRTITVDSESSLRNY